MLIVIQPFFLFHWIISEKNIVSYVPVKGVPFSYPLHKSKVNLVLVKDVHFGFLVRISGKTCRIDLTMKTAATNRFFLDFEEFTPFSKLFADRFGVNLVYLWCDYTLFRSSKSIIEYQYVSINLLIASWGTIKISHSRKNNTVQIWHKYSRKTFFVQVCGTFCLWLQVHLLYIVFSVTVVYHMHKQYIISSAPTPSTNLHTRVGSQGTSLKYAAKAAVPQWPWH